MAFDESSTADERERAALEAALGAQYEMLRPLGRGGMGAVYLARERLLDRLVAIKVLRGERDDEESRERFLQEARTAARLTHPNIVPLYSFGQSDDAVFYVMGYVDGESLEAHLRRVGRLAPDVASRILAELASALDYAHRNGVVHRDIKPDNILIDRATGQAMLTDFGIAKRTDAALGLTKTGIIVGTPHYMSPEQATGDRSIDGRSDLYSLGVVGYRMISGRLPFESTNVQELLAAHAARTPPSLATLVPETDASLAGAVMRCLEKQPEYRWRGAGEFRRAIDASGDSAVALPDGLEHLAGHAIKFGAAFYAMDIVALGMWGGRGTPDWLVIAGGVLPVSYLMILSPSFFLARRAGFSVRQTLSLMFRQPSWWGGWWPRRARNPGDVWDRLPAPVRRIRSALSALNTWMFGVVIPVSVPWVVHGLAGPDPRNASPALMSAAIAVLAPSLFFVFPGRAFRAWSKATALPRATRSKMTYERTFNSRFWSREDIAPLLAQPMAIPAAELPSRSVPALVGDIERAMADVARFDPRLADDVRTAVREIAEHLQKLEPEIDNLAQHRDDDELVRLAQRLRSMDRSDDPAMRQMRALVGQQLALLRGLQTRQAELEERYDTWLSRLHTLWLQLRTLRAQQVAESAEAAEITGRIRALCASVGHLNAAIDEVNQLTRTPG